MWIVSAHVACTKERCLVASVDFKGLWVWAPHLMGEENQGKQLAKDMGPFRTALPLLSPTPCPHSQIMPERLYIIKIIWKNSKTHISTALMLIKQLSLCKKRPHYFPATVRFSPPSELLCPTPWIKLSWVSENISNCLMSGRTNYRVLNCFNVIWGEISSVSCFKWESWDGCYNKYYVRECKMYIL